MMLDDALAYAARGWRVFPLLPNSKLPATQHGCKDATTDLEAVRRLFTRNSGNIGIATGNGLVVIDLDVKSDRNGLEAWHALCAPQEALQDTFECLTPSGGRHLYFRLPQGIVVQNSASKLGAGIDVRGEGGYVVAPPSTIDGKAYAWELSNPPQLPATPAWLLALLTTPAKKSRTPLAVDATGRIPRGQQDTELHRLACKLTKEGLAPEIIRASVRAAAAACQQDASHPFTDADVERWVSRAARLVETNEARPAWASFNVPITGRSQPICNADSALHILEQHPALHSAIWFDTFRNAILTTWEHRTVQEWADWDTQRLLVFLQRHIGLTKMTKTAVEDALGVFVSTRTKHEV